MAGFDTETAAFFDELSKMRDEVRRVRDDGIERDSQRPFQGTLTQGEEYPYIEYWRSPLQYNDEPEVILGRRIA